MTTPDTTDSTLESRLGYTLSATTDDGRARADALASTEPGRIESDGVGYASAGRVLVIGADDDALAVAQSLAQTLECTVVLPPNSDAENDERTEPAPDRAVTRLRADIDSISGHLGAFTVTARVGGEPIELAPSELTGGRPFDLVLDLARPARIVRPIPPPGYFAPEDGASLEAVLEQLPELVGEFEKPKFFDYDPDICAHGARGLAGCTRCLDACPTEAIISIGEKVEVDPYLCQGGGVCAAVCPTGAMTYRHPPVELQLEFIRRVLRRYREASGARPIVLFHDHDDGEAAWLEAAGLLPERILPIAVEEVGSVGIDTWLSVVAYGARALVVLTPSVPERVVAALDEQLAIAQTLLDALGIDRGAVSFARSSDELAEIAGAKLAEFAHPPATFAAVGEKRNDLSRALDHLYEHAVQPPQSVGLPGAAPFGQVEADPASCTLCMACVSVCPASALQAGGDAPRLSFIEGNCVQCGLCERACPERCVSRETRYLFGREARREIRVLNEDRPFACVSCGKVFGTTKVIERMLEKLQGHWMFQDDKARARLTMCEDCRVKDMFRE